MVYQMKKYIIGKIIISIYTWHVQDGDIELNLNKIMTKEVFNGIVQNRLDKIQSTLISKGKEYQRNADVLHNFEKAAKMGNTTREKALWGFALKHYVSFMDILDDLEKGEPVHLDLVEEKIGDLINYLILAEASIKDRV